MKESVFGLMTKTHDFHVGDYEFETHKVDKSFIIYIRVWKCIGWLDFQLISKKRNKKKVRRMKKLQVICLISLYFKI